MQGREMTIRDHCDTEDKESHQKRRQVLFGLIDDTCGLRTELHGFEVSLDGRVVVPELHPKPEDRYCDAFTLIKL
jgi:hypothetical protein